MKAAEQGYFVCCRCNGLVPFQMDVETLEREADRVFQKVYFRVVGPVKVEDSRPILVELTVSLEDGNMCEACEREYLGE